MDGGRERLNERVRALLNALERATAVLLSASVDQKWRARIGMDFFQTLKAQKGHLERVLRTGTPAALSKDEQAAQLTSDWGAFANARPHVERDIKQCLALAQGAVARSANLDGGTCAIADALISELDEQAKVAWIGFTVMADDDAFLSVDEIVRVRFPPGDVWSLPITVHEFGHYATSRLDKLEHDGSRSQVFEGYLQELEQSGRGSGGGRHYREFFADAFATYALGPAFARTALLVRFDPFMTSKSEPSTTSKSEPSTTSKSEPSTTSKSEPSTHPGELRRAHVILAVLREVASSHLTHFTGASDLLEEDWQCTVKDSTGRRRQPQDFDKLTGLAKRFHKMLQASRPGLEYKGWSRAQSMQAALTTDGEPPADVSIADVLNAAWMAKLDGKDVGSRAWTWCETIARQR